jgi:hypothetical protein
MEPIVNRVAESDIEVFNLEELWDGGEVSEFDMAPFLHQGLIVREKEFRIAAKDHDWSVFKGHHVAIRCSTDAIVPTWAYMVLATRLEGIAATVSLGRREDLLREYYIRTLKDVDWSRYADRVVVIKGCASDVVPPDAYLIATGELQRVARKIMYGEPCSAVPIWRSSSGRIGRPDGARPARLPGQS